MSKNKVLFKTTGSGSGKKVHIHNVHSTWLGDTSYCGRPVYGSVSLATNFTGLNDKNLCKTCKKAYKAAVGRGARV